MCATYPVHPILFNYIALVIPILYGVQIMKQIPLTKTHRAQHYNSQNQHNTDNPLWRNTTITGIQSKNYWQFYYFYKTYFK
jgi:hypothetical protein